MLAGSNPDRARINAMMASLNVQNIPGMIQPGIMQAPMQQPMQQPMGQPMMQPMGQPMMQPMGQPMMQPMQQPMMQPPMGQ